MIKGHILNVGWCVFALAFTGCGAATPEDLASGTESGLETGQETSAVVVGGEAFVRVSAAGVTYAGAYNSVGSTPTVFKNATGKYRVQFPNMGGTFNPHVVAVSATSAGKQGEIAG